MYDMLSSASLAQTLNQYSVPMYVLEQAELGAPFKFVYLNDALEQALLCDRWDIIGKSLEDALPVDEAPISQRRLAHCVDSQKIMRFSDHFSITEDRFMWDTTLQPITLIDGRRRVVATCIQHNPARVAQAETHALEDIQYFSSLADFQLQNLISMFDTYQPRDLFEVEAEQRIAKLSGMCRTVQVAVAEIRKTVQSAKGVRQTEMIREIANLSSQADAKLKRCGTMKALTDLSTE